MLGNYTRQIDGSEFKVVEFAGQRNFDILIDLSRMVGPALGRMLSGYDDQRSMLDQEIDLSTVADTLFRDMNKAEVKDLVARLLESTFLDDSPVNQHFDEVFAGKRIWRLPKVLQFVLECNFGDFSELGASITGLPGGAVSKGEVREG